MFGRRTKEKVARAGSGPLSIHDPVYLGETEDGKPATLSLPGRSLLAGGLPSSGKSSAQQVITAHCMLSVDVTRAYFFDANAVQLGMWRSLATEFITTDVVAGIEILKDLGAEIDVQYADMLRSGIRKVERGGGYTLLVVDELAFYTSVYGEPKQQREFAARLRDVVARGRAAGIIPILATQRPSSDVVPTSLRDLVQYRAAFSVVNNASSDVILGEGWAGQGYSAAAIPSSDDMAGVSLLRSESGIPFKLRWAWLSDDDLRSLVITAQMLRSGTAA